MNELRVWILSQLGLSNDSMMHETVTLRARDVVNNNIYIRTVFDDTLELDVYTVADNTYRW